MKELNKELSQKLEVQTQRLELLTSQSMASENVATKQPTSSHIVRESVTYADEGDEVPLLFFIYLSGQGKGRGSMGLGILSPMETLTVNAFQCPTFLVIFFDVTSDIDIF